MTAARLITVSAAARFAMLSPQTVRRWCRSKGLGRKVGGRIMIDVEAFEALLSGSADCGDEKKCAQLQQVQQVDVCEAGQGLYSTQEDPGALPMLTAETLPPRPMPNGETVSASLPFGARERIRAAAAAERLTMGEYVRRAILAAAAPDLLTGAR